MTGLAQLEEKAAAVDFDAARRQIADGRAQIADGRAQLEQQKQAAYAQAEAAAKEAAKAEVEEATRDTAAQLDAAQEQLEQLKASFEQMSGQLQTLQSQVADIQSQIDALLAQEVPDEQKLAELEGQRDALNSQISTLEPMVQALKNTYDTSYESGMAAIADGRAQIAAALEAAMEQAVQQAHEAVDAQLAQNEEYTSALAMLDENEAALNASEEQLKAGEQEISEARATLAATYDQLASGQAQLDAGKAELEASQAQLDRARAQLEDGQAQIDEARAELEDGKAELEDGWAEYEDAKAEAEEELEDGKDKIDDARAEVDDIEYPQWYVSDRSTLSGNAELGDNADRIRAIGEIFPVLFFLVAALISLTTMTRMVEEERIQIGTLKALGYSKGAIAKKYMYYALLATISGSIVGVLFGEKVFPYIIVNAYKIVYPYIPNTTIPYNAYYGLLASLTAIICITAATFLACYKELLATPASLMRPVPPKQGRRILLERFTLLWRHLSFTQKSTLRNLFRYKKRFFMTVFGIGGCMALMIVGFGLKDSISDIVDLQYNKIQTYSGMVVLDDDASDQSRDELYRLLDEESQITEYKTAYMMNSDVASDSETMEAYIVVPENMENLNDFLYFNDRISGRQYQLTDDGVIISEKTASLLGVGVGDTLKIFEDEFTPREVKIQAICENYVGHYIYMTPSLYEQTFGNPADYNTILIKVADVSAENAVGQKLLNEDAVVSVSYMESIKSTMDDMLGSLDIIIVVLIISAGMLAFIVLYNLNNININERRRELASIKVLGFYDLEVAAYVYRENIYLTLIGMVFGCILGNILHRFIIVTVEIDSCMFGRIVYGPSYIYSMLLTVAFSILVNIAMFYKLRKIDMVESLKSVE